MKIKSLLVVVLLVSGVVVTPVANAAETPVVESFTFTPNDIDVISQDLRIVFNLTVSHPSGIESTSTRVRLTDGKSFSLETRLQRSDSPVDFSLKRVTFQGSLLLPRNFSFGVYEVTAEPISNNPIAGYKYDTGTIYPDKIRNLLGVEKSLLVRQNGYLNYDFVTFAGPYYNNQTGTPFINGVKFATIPAPLWKVGETYDPNNYYELRAPNIKLQLISKTPQVCQSFDSYMKLISAGTCTFTVYTKKDFDFNYKSNEETVNVSNGRVKPTIYLEKLPDVKPSKFPLLIQIPDVFSMPDGWILPRSITPEVCLTNRYSVQLFAGGICNLEYQTSESSDYLPSDIFKQSFSVIKNSQTITFSPVTSIDLASKSLTLAAAVSSAGTVIFTSTPSEICSVSGTTLNLLKPGACNVTATQPGTGTIAGVSASSSITITGAQPVVKKTITCVKGKKSVKKTAISPKCPAGYKLKK